MNPVSLNTFLMSSFTPRMITLLPVDLAPFRMLSKIRRPLEAIYSRFVQSIDDVLTVTLIERFQYLFSLNSCCGVHFSF